MTPPSAGDDQADRLLGELRATNARLQTILERVLQEQNPHVMTERELDEIDSKYAFVVPTQETCDSIYERAAARLNDSENAKACAVCELGFRSSDVSSVKVTKTLLKRMRKILEVPQHVTPPIPQFILDQYDCSLIARSLRGILLCPEGVSVDDAGTTRLVMCKECKTCLTQQRPCIPQLAIANGNYIGRFPGEDLKWIEEQMVALSSPCVSITTVSGGRHRVIRSHHYVVKNTAGALISMLPEEVAGRIRVTMVGAMTPHQVAICRARYEVNVGKCLQALEFFGRNHSSYQSVEFEPWAARIQSAEVAILDDRTDTSSSPVAHKIVNDIDDTATYSIPNDVDATDSVNTRPDNDPQSADDNESEWVEGRAVVLDHTEQPSDYLIRRSNVFEVNRHWASVTQMFPTLIPGGCGGPEQARKRRMSLRTWILRCLRLHHCRFERHEVFLLLAFDYLAMEAARNQMFVRLNITEEAVRAGQISRETVVECVQYYRHVQECERVGVTPQPPTATVQAVLNLKRGIDAGEVAHYGSNLGRSKARHDLLGYISKLGPLQLFFTISPDSAGTYNTSLAAGEVSKRQVSVASQMLRSRAQRRVTATRHPFQCAQEFSKIIDVLIEEVLGWDQEAKRPKRIGGLFGLVRAYSISAETQAAGDLHAHCAVWLHGFPTRVTEMDFMVRNNADFNNRLVDLVNATATTVLPTTPCSCPNTSPSDDQHQPCGGQLLPLDLKMDHFMKPHFGSKAPPTSSCCTCSKLYAASDLIDAGIASVNAIDESERSHIRARNPPVPKPTQDIDDFETACIARDVQVHTWKHTPSCFKATKRTPSGTTCRFLRPVEANLSETRINKELEVEHYRPVGSEYVNPYNPTILRLFRCNHDVRIVISSTSKDVVAYICKYVMKPQKHVENGTAYTLAAFHSSVLKADAAPNAQEMTTRQRGNKILASWLYSVTNRQEIVAPLAALFILRESPFWFSHEVVRINLVQLLQVSDKQTDGAVLQVSPEILDRNVPMTKNPSTLQAYWTRPYAERNYSFSKFLEQGKANRALSPPAIVIICGKQLPDLDTDTNPEDEAFFYKSLLLLFKPHHENDKLVPDGSSPKEAYEDFLHLNEQSIVGPAIDYQHHILDSHAAAKAGAQHQRSKEAELRSKYGADVGLHHTTPQFDNVHDDDDSDQVPPGVNWDTPSITTDARLQRAEDLLSAQTIVLDVINHAAAATPPDINDLVSSSPPSDTNSPPDVSACDGTTKFLLAYTTHETRLAAITEYLRPVPWAPPTHSTAIGIDDLPPFAPIRQISQALRLNFWQHVAFETTARHVLYSYAQDIQANCNSAFPQPDEASKLQHQLVGFLGGEAGAGKSTVIQALLRFARLWQREGSIETLSFTGVAAVNIQGRTIHSARHLPLSVKADKNHPPSEEMKQKFSRVALTIIDEISMTDQTLLGRADNATRSLVEEALRKPVWGRRHLLLCGDWMQIPPVCGTPAFRATSDRHSERRRQGYALYASINFVVFLIENMRSRLDPVYTSIMRRLRTNTLTDEDINLLNTRVGVIPPHTGPSRSFRPVAVSSNALRVAINLQSIMSVARSTRTKIFECIAEPASRSRARFIKLCNLDDTCTARIPFKLMYYFGMPVIVSKNSTDPALASIIANGTMGHIVGHILGRATVSSTVFEGVDIQSLSSLPDALLVKLLHTTTQFDPNLPPGTVAITPFHGQVQVDIPNGADSKLFMTIRQFPLVPAFALTPEKLQGQTCADGLTIMNLQREKGSSPQILYVAFSRSVALDKLTLASPISRYYLNQFRSQPDTLQEIRRLIELVVLPDYTAQAQMDEYSAWKADQLAI